jgi:DnaJ-domain-containing protein 1
MGEILNIVVYLAIGLGLGYALIISGRELVSGFKTAKTQFFNTQTDSSDRKEENTADTTTTPGIKPWHEVLGVGPAANLQQIKAAYRKKISQYHPDKTAGLGDELRRVAELYTKEINLAYASACKLHGV